MVTAVGVFLVALGAVLAFAVDASLPGVNVFLAGLLMMLVGAAGVAIAMTGGSPRRRVSTPAYRPRTVVRRTAHL